MTKPPTYERPELPFERKASPEMREMRWAMLPTEFGVTVVLFFLVGFWLDGKLGTAPWLTVAGVLAGVSAGTALLVRSVLRSARTPPAKGEPAAGTEPKRASAPPDEKTP